MGGAPPPPLDFAPQGPKNRRNSALWAGFREVWRPRGSTSRTGGWRGLQPTTHLRILGWFRAVGPEIPRIRRFSRRDGSGNQVWRRSEPTWPDLPRPPREPQAMVCLGIQTRRAQRVAEGPLRLALIAVAATRVRHAVVALRRLLEHVRDQRAQALRNATASAGTPNKCVTCRGPSRHVTLCLGDMTDALRESGAKRIAGWGSDYRAIRGLWTGAPEPPPGTPPGPPGRDPPGGPPGARGRPGAARGRGRPGGARGRPGTPRRGLPGTPQNGPFLGPIYTIFYITDPPFGGPRRGALLGPRGPGTPGGQKSAHFFGYLITLPVGTVWGPPAGPPGTGPFWGYPGDSRLGQCL